MKISIPSNYGVRTLVVLHDIICPQETFFATIQLIFRGIKKKIKDIESSLQYVCGICYLQKYLFFVVVKSILLQF